ncbi:MAG: ammonium transporter [Rhodospirillales bacterium]
MKPRHLFWMAGALSLAAVPLPALAQEFADKAEMEFVLNTFAFLMCGALVMWMAAGFAMLESGLVRTKNTASICLKNIGLFSIACIMYYLIGYSLMYADVDGGWIGSFSIFYNLGGSEAILIGADEKTPEMIAEVTGNGYSVMSDWFFQVVFVATAASIVSGTLAERVKIWPFLIFVVILTGVIYPIQGSWTWGGGWLNEVGDGFSDFAGSTIVHSVGGWAALAGALILGPRKGKYHANGTMTPMPGANLPLATLGTFILWLGWFGFNGGSELALGTAANAANMSLVFANTNLAACGGVVVAILMTQALYGKIDLTMSLNGAIGGLVAITANPDIQHSMLAIIIGGVGGALVVFFVPLFDKLKIDDVVGAISVHLIAGIWGTLAVAIFDDGDFYAQIVGIVAIGAFTFISSALVWLVLKYTIGIRVDEEAEAVGLDKAELGQEAYPEFGQGAHSIN